MRDQELLRAVEEALDDYESDEGSRGKHWHKRRLRPRPDKRRTPSWPPPNPNPLPRQTCPNERRIALQKQVHPLCDVHRVPGCPDFESRPGSAEVCRDLMRRADEERRCVEIRGLINRECFGGGDEEHRRKWREARNRLNACRELYRGKGCAARLGGRDFFEDDI